MPDSNQNTFELDTWENGVPVIVFQENPEFVVWENETPTVNQKTPAAPVVTSRRRFFDF